MLAARLLLSAAESTTAGHSPCGSCALLKWNTVLVTDTAEQRCALRNGRGMEGLDEWGQGKQ